MFSRKVRVTTGLTPISVLKLLELGARNDITDSEGYTPLDVAKKVANKKYSVMMVGYTPLCDERIKQTVSLLAATKK